MNYYNNQGGRIEVICGPMFAGKTEELIRRDTRMEYAHKNFLVFKPLIDNRYSIDEVVSHSKYKKKAINIKEAKEIIVEKDIISSEVKWNYLKSSIILKG